jgi:hypothetical protein
MPPIQATSPHDPALSAIPGLAWLPWVGAEFEKKPRRERVLIVAESQSYGGDQPPGHCPHENERLADRGLTRAMVATEMKQGRPAPQDRSPTLASLDRLLYRPGNRTRFWSGLALHHFVQRPTWCPGWVAEPPTGQDYFKGWEVLVRVIEVLQPGSILVVGLDPAYCFNAFMEEHGGAFVPVTPISPCHYQATVGAGAEACEIHFIKEVAKSLQPEIWRAHLERTAGSLMSHFRALAETDGAVGGRDHLHVMGTVLTPFDLVRGETDKLELALLRLARAVTDFAEVGEPAVAYLRILDRKMGKAAADLARKHRIGEETIIVCDQTTGDNHRELVRQMTVGVFNWVREMRYDGANWEPSLAELGREAAIKQLEFRIRGDFDGLEVRRIPRFLEFCQFYGTVVLDWGAW